MVTQRHIAELAGVNRSTVSCVLRGTGNIRPEVREKITGIIQRLGYVPNANATALRKSESNLIGVVSSSTFNPYHAILVQHLADELRPKGYRLLLGSRGNSESEQHRDIVELLDQRAAGVIICTTHPKLISNVRRILGHRIPMVLVGPVREGPSVSCSLREGGFLAGQHLIEMGRRRLVYVDDTSGMPGEEFKASGFLEATRHEAAWCRPMRSTLWQRVTDGRFWTWPWAEELLEDFPDVDGVFTSSDLIASVLVSRLGELGKRVPQEIAVVGFDDIPQARYAAVPLTTVRQPIADYAKVAVELLLEQLQGTTANDTRHRLPCKLIVRKSTDPGWIPTSESQNAGFNTLREIP